MHCTKLVVQCIFVSYSACRTGKKVCHFFEAQIVLVHVLRDILADIAEVPGLKVVDFEKSGGKRA